MAKPKILVEPPGPKSRMFLERWKKCGTGFSKLETCFCSAHGMYIEDVDGNTYMDFTSDGEICNIGHSNPKVVAAIKGQVEKTGATGFQYGAHELRIALAEKIKSIAPGQLSKGKVAFTTTGSDTTEFCMKLSRAYTHRMILLAYLGCHHGYSLGALSLSTDSSQARRRCLPLLPEIVHIPYPYCYRCPFKIEYPDCDLACFDYINYVLDRAVSPLETAALFVEPIQQLAGVIVPPANYFSKVKALCDQHEILFVDDEVATGLGKTGRMFAIEHWDIEPDIMYLAKPVASGLPMGVIIGKKEIMAKEEEFRMVVGGAFAGNLLSCASALTFLEVVQKEKLQENAKKMGDYVLKRLNEECEECDHIGEVRGKGLLVGIEIVESKRNKIPDGKKAEEIVKRAFKKGLILTNVGTYHQVLRITPPLNITKDEIDTGLSILEEAITEVCPRSAED